MAEERAAKLADDPRVAFVEEDGVASGTATQANPPWESTGSISVCAPLMQNTPTIPLARE